MGNYTGGRADQQRPPAGLRFLRAYGSGLLAAARVNYDGMMLDRTWTLTLNTAALSGATCLIGLPLGTALAWLLVRTDLPGRRIGLVLAGILVFVPLYLQAAAWQAGFGLQGWCTLAFQAPVWLEGWSGAIWVHVMAALPWIVLIVGGGFWLVEPELEEQALLDGSWRQVFLRVTFLRARASIGIAALWVLIVTAGEMTVTDLFDVRTYAEELYTRFAVMPDPDQTPLAALPGVLLTTGLILAGLAVCARAVPGDRLNSLRSRPVFRLGGWRWPAALLAGTLFLLLIGVPLGNLVYKAGVVVTQVDAGRVRHWSLEKLLTIVGVSPIRYRSEFGWSLALSSLAATAAVFLGIGLAWWTVGSGQKAVSSRPGTGLGRGLRAGVLLAIAAVCLAVPAPLIGLATIWLLNRPGWPTLNLLYDQSILAPWLVLTVRGLAPALVIMWHTLSTLPAEMLDSAALDGAGWLTRLWRIALPCRIPAVGLAWLVAFAVALGDLAASILVAPPGMTTLSIRIFGLLHSGVEDYVAGICLSQLLLFAVLAAAVIRLTSRWQDNGAAGRNVNEDGRAWWTYDEEVAAAAVSLTV